ncbi:hypothetical protein DMH04_45890 [Kibdelosporangium aridum]|uniref:Uncharacterized protein n=1 Tax=Kibdelosporangium aridum TaxID=2030 RepID=A0A428YN72_KIBAR|nr:hypothetical protein DMH04_45890 [Kibdelosporangium aridum]
MFGNVRKVPDTDVVISNGVVLSATVIFAASLASPDSTNCEPFLKDGVDDVAFGEFSRTPAGAPGSGHVRGVARCGRRRH